MIISQESFAATHDRLIELRVLRKKIESDTKLNHRQRSSELAGVNGLLEEIEHEIRDYQLGRLQERLQNLQARAATTPPSEMPDLVSQVIATIQELTQALQPTA